MGIAELDNTYGILWIRAHIIIYGDAATEPLAIEIGHEIETYWNQPKAVVIIRGQEFSVVFKITAAYHPHLQPDEVYYNDDPLMNYFRVESYAATDISFVDGIGSNTGYFKLDNLLNNSTTAAHEFGHTIGLEHPAHLDLRGQGTPGIMYPRGTFVDPHFQYDPSVAAGTKGGTINPTHRKVLQKDIEDLQLHKLSFDKNGKAILGDFSSVFHHKHENTAT
jgi:hypothetical protein